MSIYYKKEGRIAIITLNRPEALNAINDALGKELDRIILDFRDNPIFGSSFFVGHGEK